MLTSVNITFLPKVTSKKKKKKTLPFKTQLLPSTKDWFLVLFRYSLLLNNCSVTNKETVFQNKKKKTKCTPGLQKGDTNTYSKTKNMHSLKNTRIIFLRFITKIYASNFKKNPTIS